MPDDRPTADPLRRPALAWAGLVAVALALRLPSLRALPVFNDEAVFALWARIVARDLGQFFVSFQSEGKQGLFVWIAAPIVRLVSDPVLATRLTAALLSLLALPAAWGLAIRLRGRNDRVAGFVAAFLCAVTPFAVVHDRLGMYDSLVAALGTWTFLLALRAADDGGRRAAVALGAVLGAALVTKEYCAVFLAYPVLAAVDRAFVTRKRPAARAIAALAGGTALAGAIWLAVNAVPRLRGLGGHPMGHYFVGGASEVAAQLVANLSRIAEIHAAYTGAPLAALFLAGVAFHLRARRPGILAAALAVAGVTVLQAAVAKHLFARYLLFTVPLVAAVAAAFLADAADALASRLAPRAAPDRVRRWIAAAGVLAVLAFAIPRDAAFLRDPRSAPYDPGDRWQFVAGWPSGHGTPEAIAYARSRSAERPIDLFFLPVAGVPLDAFALAFEDDPRVRLHLAPWALERPLLFFASENRALPGAPRDVHRRLTETIDPKALGDVYFVADPPMIDLPAFLARNGAPVSAAAFKKPGGESAIVVLEMAVPGRLP